MKLLIQSDCTTLAGPLRAYIEQRVRLVVGVRAARIDVIQVLFSTLADAPTRIRCRVKLKDEEGIFDLHEESARTFESAFELAVWRLRHFLDRHALRSGRERRSA